jgi:hypothetical protein
MGCPLGWMSTAILSSGLLVRTVALQKLLEQLHSRIEIKSKIRGLVAGVSFLDLITKGSVCGQICPLSEGKVARFSEHSCPFNRANLPGCGS